MEISRVKPHLKTLSASGAPLYVLGDGMLIAQTPNFTVKVLDSALDCERCVLSAVKFQSFISKAKTLFSVLKMDNGVRLVSGSLSVDFPDLDTKIQEVAPTYTHHLPTNTLKELLIYASAVTDPSATMTYAGVVQIVAEEDFFEDNVASTVRVSATDGYRAVRMSSSCATTPINLMIPATLVAAVVTFDADTTEIAETENYLAFRSGAVEAVATKFAVKLPDIGAAFPSRTDIRMSVVAEDLKNTLGNISPFLDTKAPDVVCSFEQRLVITTGTARDELEYQIVSTVRNPAAAEPYKKFKTPAKFLTDFLSKTQGTVQIETDTFDRMLFTNGSKKYILAAKV